MITNEPCINVTLSLVVSLVVCGSLSLKYSLSCSMIRLVMEGEYIWRLWPA